MNFPEEKADLGKQAEQHARIKLQRDGWWITQIDWMGKKDGIWVWYEIKGKEEPFSPPPFEGHGLELYKVKMRAEFLEDTGIRSILMVQDLKNMCWFIQWLDLLEKGERFVTRNNLVIYPLEAFNKE